MKGCIEQAVEDVAKDVGGREGDENGDDLSAGFKKKPIMNIRVDTCDASKASPGRVTRYAELIFSRSATFRDILRLAGWVVRHLLREPSRKVDFGGGTEEKGTSYPYHTLPLTETTLSLSRTHAHRRTHTGSVPRVNGRISI